VARTVQLIELGGHANSI